MHLFCCLWAYVNPACLKAKQPSSLNLYLEASPTEYNRSYSQARLHRIATLMIILLNLPPTPCFSSSLHCEKFCCCLTVACQALCFQHVVKEDLPHQKKTVKPRRFKAGVNPLCKQNANSVSSQIQLRKDLIIIIMHIKKGKPPLLQTLLKALYAAVPHGHI